jgi:hypothetical protein
MRQIVQSELDQGMAATLVESEVTTGGIAETPAVTAVATGRDLPRGFGVTAPSADGSGIESRKPEECADKSPAGTQTSELGEVMCNPAPH